MLQRPLPVVRIFLPIRSVASIIATSIPYSFARIADIRPEAPPPTIIIS